MITFERDRGILAYYLVLVGWRRCHLIFLDLLCIDQENATAKAEAIFSLGAFLKSHLVEDVSFF